MISSARKVIIIALAALAFSASAVSQTPSVTKGDLASPNIVEGIAALEAGKYEEAARDFNRAVAYRPNVSALHVFTGVAYHLAASHGKPELYDLAETGYELAARLDPTNYFAQLQLGRLFLDTRRYTDAQQAFAQVLDVERDSGDAAYGLAVASYYARDLDSAASAIRLADRLRPQDAEVQRASALIWGAIGMKDKSLSARTKYGTLETDSERVKLLDRRMDQWQEVTHGPDLQVAQLFSVPSTQGPANVQPSTPGPVALHWGDCLPNGQQLQMPNLTGNLDDLSPMPALPSPCTGRPTPRMAMIDAAIIRTEESVDTFRGINLLEGLQLVFGYSRTSNHTDNGLASTGVITTSRAVGLPQAGVSYALNIANATELRTDVLSRPTLTVLDRLPSQFFSGSNLTIAVPGQLSGGTVVEKPIGVTLTVTPTFIDDDSMLLSVKAGRSDVQVGAPGSFDQALSTSRNAVTTNVVLRFNETLILSGMHDHATVVSKSGVPVLRDVPLIQYLFSNSVTEERQKSILITLTPRRPTLTMQGADPDSVTRETPDALGAELRERLNRDYSLPPNSLAIVRALSANRYIKQFRSGDLREDDWRTKRSLENFLRTLSRFLYY